MDGWMDGWMPCGRTVSSARADMACRGEKKKKKKSAAGAREQLRISKGGPERVRSWRLSKLAEIRITRIRSASDAIPKCRNALEQPDPCFRLFHPPRPERPAPGPEESAVKWWFP